MEMCLCWLHNSFVASFLSMKEKDGEMMPCISSMLEHGKAESFFQKFAHALSHEHCNRFTIWFDSDMKVISTDFWEFGEGKWVPVFSDSGRGQLSQILGWDTALNATMPVSTYSRRSSQLPCPMHRVPMLSCPTLWSL